MNKQEIGRAIRDYHWMLREIARLRSYLADAGENITPPYGVIAVMPKPQGGLPRDPVCTEATERESKCRQLADYERQVAYVQRQAERVTGRDRAILECLLDGQQQTAVAHQFQCSESAIRWAKKRIIEQMVI